MKINYKQGILIAFGELFLKSEGVKKLFIQKLVWNIQYFLRREGVEFKIHVLHDRLFLETSYEKAEKIVKRISGISWFTKAYLLEEKDVVKFIKENHKEWIKKGETFALRIKSDKREELIDKIAKEIKRKVNLSNPAKEIFIESKKDKSFIYFEKEKGLGGLPSSVSGKVLMLMSGGIDSPVASFLLAKRGAENIWLHFHSFPLVSNKSIEKTKELALKFLDYQQKLKIYYIPFSKLQSEIKLKVPEQYRVLLYRRFMLRIAQEIAEKENCLALATGESLGQVSSQTLPNINIIEEAVKISVLRPLITKDKEEIIKIAKEIGTYDISIKPQEDCCTLFVAKHSSASGSLKYIKELEKKIRAKGILKEIEKGVKIETCP